MRGNTFGPTPDQLMQIIFVRPLKRTLPARIGLLLVSVGLLTFVTGCQRSVEAPPSARARESVLDQLQRGRASESDRVELYKRVVDDSELESLSPADVWLETLILDAGKIGDRGVAMISELPNLQHLRLRNSPVTDTGFRSLVACRSLRVLNLPQCDATPAGVRELAELPNLRNLRLGGKQLTSETADAVATIHSLRQVHLIDVPVDDRGLKLIASLPKLQSLYLDDSRVTPRGWDWLFDRFPDLHVHVNQQHLDRGFQHE